MCKAANDLSSDAIHGIWIFSNTIDIWCFECWFAGSNDCWQSFQVAQEISLSSQVLIWYSAIEVVSRACQMERHRLHSPQQSTSLAPEILWAGHWSPCWFFFFKWNKNETKTKQTQKTGTYDHSYLKTILTFILKWKSIRLCSYLSKYENNLNCSDEKLWWHHPVKKRANWLNKVGNSWTWFGFIKNCVFSTCYVALSNANLCEHNTLKWMWNWNEIDAQKWQ